MNVKGIVFILLGIGLAVPIFIATQMLLPFPYGMIFGLCSVIGLIGVGIIFAKKTNKIETRQSFSQTFCPKCGAKNNSKNQFCTKCGMKINNIDQP